MKITILGAGCGIPSPKFGAPGHLIDIDGEPLLFDMGSGTLVRLQKAGEKYTRLRYIFLTHFHSDHAAEVAPLIQALWTTPFFTRTEPLAIFGPEGLDDFLKSLASAFGEWVYEPEFPLEIHEMKNSDFFISSTKISSRPMSHRQKKAIGFRVDDSAGKSVVYSGDTDVCDEIIDLAKDADVLILECSFPEKRKMEGHLIPREAAEIAEEAQVKKLVLTHFYPPYDELFAEIEGVVPKIFNGEFLIAEDLMSISV